MSTKKRWRTRDFSLVPANFEPEVRSQMSPTARLEIGDVILRDGEGTPSVKLSARSEAGHSEVARSRPR